VVLGKISWTDCVKNDEVLRRVKEERNILHKIGRRKANWIGHILLRNCLLNKLLKEIWKGRRDEEEEVSSYCMTLRERGDIGSCKREH
jgi:hypothetical protein